MERNKNKVILFYGKQSDDQINDWIPYNLLYLIAPLVNVGFEVYLINEFTEPHYENIIRQHANESIVFGVSAFTSRQITSGLNASQIFRKYAPEAPIVWGGHHAKALPEQTLRHRLIDIVFTGPSECAFVRVVDAIRSGGNLKDCPGILFKDNDKIISTGSPVLFDLSELPPFPFHLCQIERYINPRTRVLNYTASCGCHGFCSFCPWNGPHPWASLPVKRVLDDIEWLVREYNPQTIFFTDANFFANREFVMEFCEGIEKRHFDIYWYGSTRVIDFLKFSKEEIERLKRAGLTELFLGIEQTSERMKRLLRKPFRLEHVDTLLERTTCLDLKIRLSFLFGLPTETMEDLEDAYKHITRWRYINENVVIQAGQYKPYPGSSTYELVVANGLIPPNTLEEWGTFRLLTTRHRRSEEENNIWNDVPWFSDSLNKAYGNRFLELFPYQEGITFKEASGHYEFVRIP